eukprot:10747439-Alexandrium_andersonii.AAC.1
MRDAHNAMLDWGSFTTFRSSTLPAQQTHKVLLLCLAVRESAPKLDVPNPVPDTLVVFVADGGTPAAHINNIRRALSNPRAVEVLVGRPPRKR